MGDFDPEDIPPAVLEVFRHFAVRMAADLHDLDSSYLDVVADASTPDEFTARVSEYCIERFNRCAEWLSPLAASPQPHGDLIYRKVLDRAVQART